MIIVCVICILQIIVCVLPVILLLYKKSRAGEIYLFKFSKQCKHTRRPCLSMVFNSIPNIYTKYKTIRSSIYAYIYSSLHRVMSPSTLLRVVIALFLLHNKISVPSLIFATLLSLPSLHLV